MIILKKLNPKGFSVLQTMIAAALLSIVTLGFLSLMDNQSKSLSTYKKEYALMDEINLVKQRFLYSSDCTTNISLTASGSLTFRDNNSSDFRSVVIPLNSLKYGANLVAMNGEMPNNLGAKLTQINYTIDRRIILNREYQGRMIIGVEFNDSIFGGRLRRNEIPVIFTTAVDGSGNISLRSCQMAQINFDSAPLPPPDEPPVVVAGGTCPDGQYVKGITEIGTPVCANFPTTPPPPPPSCSAQAELVDGNCVNRCNEFSYWNSTTRQCVTVWSYRIAYECGNDSWTQALVCGVRTGSCRRCQSDGTCGSWQAISNLYRQMNPRAMSCP